MLLKIIFIFMCTCALPRLTSSRKPIRCCCIEGEEKEETDEDKRKAPSKSSSGSHELASRELMIQLLRTMKHPLARPKSTFIVLLLESTTTCVMASCTEDRTAALPRLLTMSDCSVSNEVVRITRGQHSTAHVQGSRDRPRRVPTHR